MGTIRSGVGTPYPAEVNDENQILVRAVSESIEHHINVHDKSAFQVLFEVTPTGANDLFFYIKNTDQSQNLVVEGLRLYSVSAEEVEVYLDDAGTALNGTDLTPINVNSGSAITAVGIFQEGADITGLSNGSMIDKLWLSAGRPSQYFNFEMDVVLSPNSTLTLRASTGGSLISGMVPFYYDQPEED